MKTEINWLPQRVSPEYGVHGKVGYGNLANVELGTYEMFHLEHQFFEPTVTEGFYESDES